MYSKKISRWSFFLSMCVHVHVFVYTMSYVSVCLGVLIQRVGEDDTNNAFMFSEQTWHETQNTHWLLGQS